MRAAHRYLRSPLGRWLIALLLIGLLTVGTLSPNIGLSYHGMDKLLHWAAFCFIGIALLGPLSFKKLWTLAILIILAFVLEGGQIFVPGRQAGFADFAANISGAFCAYAVVQIRLILRLERPSSQVCLPVASR